jgi:hypothetical protein
VLDLACQLLKVCQKANEGDARLQAVLERYSSMIAAKREKNKWERMLKDAKVSAMFTFLDTSTLIAMSTGLAR